MGILAEWECKLCGDMIKTAANGFSTGSLGFINLVRNSLDFWRYRTTQESCQVIDIPYYIINYIRILQVFLSSVAHNNSCVVIAYSSVLRHLAFIY